MNEQDYEPDTLPTPEPLPDDSIDDEQDDAQDDATADEPELNTAPPPAPEPPKLETELEVKATERSPEDIARAQIVVDDLQSRGVECTVEDVLFGHSLVGHVRALLRADVGARNKATTRLGDYGSSLGMTAAVLLAKMVRELRAANEPEQVAIVTVSIVTVIGLLLHSKLPKWSKRPR